MTLSIIKKLKTAVKISKATFVIIFFCFSLFACNSEQKPSNLNDVLERGVVNVGTLFGPNSYFIDAEGPAGFEYELAKKYADSIGVKLNIVPSYNFNELFYLQIMIQANLAL